MSSFVMIWPPQMKLFNLDLRNPEFPTTTGGCPFYTITSAIVGTRGGLRWPGTERGESPRRGGSTGGSSSDRTNKGASFMDSGSFAKHAGRSGRSQDLGSGIIRDYRTST